MQEAYHMIVNILYRYAMDNAVVYGSGRVILHKFRKYTALKKSVYDDHDCYD